MKLSKAYAAMLLAVISGTAMAAGSATANFQATATLNNACTVSSSNVDFGVIDATTIKDKAISLPIAQREQPTT